MICSAIELAGGFLTLIALFVAWAFFIEWRSNASMRAFSARWAKLGEEERKDEIERVRAAREMLERKRR
jgi:hypothetical protein